MDSEMRELTQRVATLEKQIQLLQEELSTLKDMRVSEQMHNYIAGMERNQRLVSLIDSVSDSGKNLDMEKENKALNDIKRQLGDIDARINTAIQKAGTFSDDMEDTSKFFSCSEYKHGVEITSYNGFDSQSIIVPKAINGRPVIRIGKEAFKNSELSSVILPSTLEEMGESAFEGCSNLTTIDLPESLQSLERGCFQRSAITRLKIPLRVTKISSMLCYRCEKLRQVALNDKIVEIEYSAFENCTSLHTIVFPNSLKEIGVSAFEETGLRKIIIPESVQKIGKEAFGLSVSISVRRNAIYIQHAAFLGKETVFPSGFADDVFNYGAKGLTIYCLPGSTAQKYARDKKIPAKPLSEFPRD